MAVRRDPLDEIGDALKQAVAPVVEHDLTLREASRQDPPKGCPIYVDGEPIEPGEWREKGFADDMGLPPGCPVRPLGKQGDEFSFLNTLGEVHQLSAASSGKGPIDALFAGRSGYLEWAWPRFGMARKGDKKPPVKGYEADEARRCLFDACAFKGVFDDQDRVRGRGSWRGDDGALIYHRGDKVLIGGEWRNPGEHGRFVYPGRPRLPVPAPAIEPGGVGSAGDLLLEVLRTWNWDRPWLDPLLMLGWIMCAPMGGALKVRPIAYLSGQEGSGKSTLQELVRGGPQCGHSGLLQGACVATGNSTQAGIYQKVKQDSVAVSMDENEPSADPRSAQRLLELARIAYSGDNMNRGGQNHDGKTFTVMSAFLFSSIAEPAMDAQDVTRMALFRLREFEPGTPEPQIDIPELQAAARQLLRRWIDHWPDWPRLLMIFRAALRDVGHDSRSADTFGTLAAASWLAIHDELPTEEDLKPWQAALKASDLAETSERQKTWQRCFRYLIDAQPDVFNEKGSDHRSVGSFLNSFRESSLELAWADRHLGRAGLAITFPDGKPESWDYAELFVPSNHPAVTSLFTGTQWAGRPGAPGPWNNVLRQAPRDLWRNDKCGKGLASKTSGLKIRLAKALEG